MSLTAPKRKRARETLRVAVTKTERLAKIYRDPQSTEEEKAAALKGLRNICIRACFGLFPPYTAETGKSGNVYSFDYRPRRTAWVAAFVEQDIESGKDARYIGRRCRNALIDLIRKKDVCEPRRKRPRKLTVIDVLIQAAAAIPRLGGLVPTIPT